MEFKGSGDIECRTVIANVSPKMDYSRGMTTQSYNALLISKAPEMLEMLGELIHMFEYNNNSQQEVDLLNKGKQLINQATEL